MAKSYSAKGHKLHTISTYGGVAAECLGEGCTWSGKYNYTKSKYSVEQLRGMSPEERATLTPENSRVKVEDQIFPRREYAVEAHNAFHRGRGE